MYAHVTNGTLLYLQPAKIKSQRLVEIFSLESIVLCVKTKSDGTSDNQCPNIEYLGPTTCINVQLNPLFPGVYCIK